MRASQWFLVCIATFVVACSTVTARTAKDYDRGSTPDAKFAKDAESCDKQAVAHQKEFGNGPYDMTRGPYNRMYDMCMQSSGYSLRPQP